MKKFIQALKKMLHRLFHGPSRKLLECPPDLYDYAEQEIQNAYAYLEKKNGKPLTRTRMIIVKVPGTHRINGRWAIRSSVSPTGWAGGDNNGTLCRIVCDPDTKEVELPSVKHEIFHSILVNQYGDFSHNPRYDEYMGNWSWLD